MRIFPTKVDSLPCYDAGMKQYQDISYTGAVLNGPTHRFLPALFHVTAGWVAIAVIKTCREWGPRFLI